MKLLDRYIARQYLTNIAALLVILACFVVAIDVSLNVSRYWNIAVEVSRDSALKSGAADTGVRRALITVVLIADIWWPRLLSLFNFLLGMVLVAAMGFTCSQLVRNRELVAVLTAGQSLFRVARPIMLVAIGMTLVQALNQELVIPRIAPLLLRDQGDAGKRNLGESKVPPTVDGMGRVFVAGSFDADRGTMADLYVWERDEAGLATRRIHAARAAWRDGGWDLDDVSVESRVQGRESAGQAPLRIQTDLDPTMLKMKRFAGYGQNLSWSQARSMLARLDELGANSEEARKTRERLQLASLGRVSIMLSNLLTLMIAMSFFLTREPRPMIFQSLKCAPVGIVSLMGAVLGTAAPVPPLPTAVSVFIPVMILIPVAIAMLSRVRS